MSDDLVGFVVEAVGGEDRVLAQTVERATRNAADGALPFAAVVVRDRMVVGVGVNTALADCDPSAHAEVTAIRDAARRTGSLNLSGAIVYSSCEPCALCRIVADNVGIAEIVFAADKQIVPRELDPDPARTTAMIEAIGSVLPHIARRSQAALEPAELAAPFRRYLDAAAL